MTTEKRRTPLGDRVAPSLRNWLAGFALRRRLPRSEALNQLLTAAHGVDAAGVDPVELLQVGRTLRGHGLDPLLILSKRLP